MNITATILDETNETFPLANIWVNGNAKTMTNENGSFTLFNVSASDIIKVTFQGYADFTSTASKFPSNVKMIIIAKDLIGPIVTTRWIKTNWLLWLGLGVGVTAIYAYNEHQNSKKIVKAKI